MKNISVLLPKISLITPSLNQGKFIEATIQSVLSQNYPNLEYIVMDGGSSDNTLEVLARYSNQIRWVSEKDRGQTNAINKGLRLADGEILAYLNADDLLMPGSLSKVAKAFMEMPGAKWVTGQCRILDEGNREIRRPITIYKNLLLRWNRYSLLFMTNYISQPATFWHHSLLEEAGFLDEDLRYVMDYEYWLRLYSRYPPILISDYLAAFKIHGDSKTTSTGHKSVYIEEERDIIQRYTRSQSLLFLHDAHRSMMTLAYSLMNRGAG